ncbi:MAG: RNA-guided endonuclease TnpB family protein, partial [Bacillota bacterium]
KAKLSYRTQKFIRPSGSTNIKIEDNYIKLPKLSWVKFSKSREVKGKINNITVSKSRSGRYYISVNVKEVIKTTLSDRDSQIGIDLGIKDFVITSNSEKVENPRHLSKYEDKLAKLQRRLSRKEEGSNNWHKLKRKIAKVHEKITNVRTDFLHKLSTRLVKENQLIAIEDLNIKGMIQNSKLAKHIADVSWGKFVQMLEYKGEWYNCIIQKVDRFFASSQTCSECGTKNPDVKDLSIRKWTCECDAEHDRDFNASLNILQEAKEQLAAS